MKIQKEVMEVLIRSEVDEENNLLFLPDEPLDRKLYVSVNKCLESIGGKWNKKLKGHLFDHNPSEDLDEMINTGEWLDHKKEYQYFPTPKDIVVKMIELANIKKGEVLLEPSAGQGSILEEFPKENPYVAIELMEDNCKVLKNKGFSVSKSDFLSVEKIDADKIIMNPPFSKQQDVQHIFHAWKLLTKDGTLVSIVSESPFFRENKLSRDFREWLVLNDAFVLSLESGDFKESGTMVKARIIAVTKK